MTIKSNKFGLRWMEEPQNPPAQELTGWEKPSQPLPGPKPQSTDLKLWNTPQPAQNSNQGDDWWTLQRKQKGEIRAHEREARLQHEREERGEDQMDYQPPPLGKNAAGRAGKIWAVLFSSRLDG